MEAGPTAGIAMQTRYSNIKSCSFNGKIEGYAGIVGIPADSVIENCHVNAEISGQPIVCGIAGSTGKLMKNCSFKGRLKANSTFGITLSVTNDGMEDCYAEGELEGEIASFGVADSLNNSTMKRCYFKGKLTTNADRTYEVCGLVGKVNSSIIEECYVDANIDNQQKSETAMQVGGIACSLSNSSEIKNCYAICNIKSKNNVGGILTIAPKSDDGKVENCYVVTTIENDSEDALNGVIYGENSKNYQDTDILATLSNVYYNKEKTTFSPFGFNKNLKYEQGAKTTSEMKTKEFLNALKGSSGNTAWKADSGNINDGMPILSWQ